MDFTGLLTFAHNRERIPLPLRWSTRPHDRTRFQALPGLRGCHIINGAGNWIQREPADQVNGLLLDFLAGL